MLDGLSLPALSTLNCGFNDGSSTGNDAEHNFQHIRVTNGATLELTGVQTVTGPVHFDDYLRFTVTGAGSVLDLGSLSQVSAAGRGRTEFVVSDASVSLPALQTVTNAIFDASNGALLSAPGAGTATYSSTDLFGSIFGIGNWNWDLLKADGMGTLLSLPALSTLNCGFDDGSSTGNDAEHNFQHIRVSNGATLDLSGVQTVTGPLHFDDYLRFTVTGAGSALDLSSLSQVNATGRGRVEFMVSDASLSLPDLQTVSNAFFHASNGATLSAPGAGTATYSSKNLTGFVPFGQGNWDWDLLKADGAGTTLSLPVLSVLNCGFDDGSSTGGDSEHNFQHVRVTNGATLDLSSVQTVTGPVRSDDFLRFTVNGTGSYLRLATDPILAPALLITNAGAGQVFIDVGSGSTVQMGNVVPASSATLTLMGAFEVMNLVITDDFVIKSPFGGTVHLGGDFVYSHTNPNDLSLGKAHLECVGDWQWLEVGGADFDIQWQVLPDDNFGFQRLTVGQDGHSTVVQLVDLHDNLQAGMADALYLFGVEDVGGTGGLEGLRILGGSTLVIGDLNVYALLDLDGNGDMERTRLHDLFPPGETRIPFNHNGNDGYIIRPEITPPIGAIDARQPSNPDGSNPAPNTTFDVVYLGDPGQVDPVDFLVEVSGGTALAVASVTSGIDIDKVTVQLNGLIPLGETTRITHLPSGSKTCIGYLPGDVNASRVSTAADITALINSLNNVPGSVRPLFATDINRSGGANASDIVRVIDLLNGAGVYDPWVNRTLPECLP